MRHPRAGIRDRWVDAVLASDVSKPCLTLLLLFACKMGDHGKVAIRREDLARMLRVHPQRIAERVSEARAAGLLDLVDGTGVRGRVAQYVAVVPHYVPDSGTHSGPIRYGPAVRTFGTHSGPNTGGYVPPSGTHNTRAYRDATVQRDELPAGDAPTSTGTGSDGGTAPPVFPLAAFSPDDERNTA